MFGVIIYVGNDHNGPIHEFESRKRAQEFFDMMRRGMTGRPFRMRFLDEAGLVLYRAHSTYSGLAWASGSTAYQAAFDAARSSYQEVMNSLGAEGDYSHEKFNELLREHQLGFENVR